MHKILFVFGGWGQGVDRKRPRNRPCLSALPIEGFHWIIGLGFWIHSGLGFEGQNWSPGGLSKDTVTSKLLGKRGFESYLLHEA
jgi:hypothetical protein